MGSGSANIPLLLDNHLSDTIKEKRGELKRRVAAVRETVSQLIELEAHALLAGIPLEDTHGPQALTSVAHRPTPPREAGGAHEAHDPV